MRIVRQSAPNEPWNWSRIWREEDFQSIMFENMAMDNLKAMILSGQLNRQKNTTIRTEVLSRMRRVEFLIIKDLDFSGNLNSLSNELRYLKWKDYPFIYFPSSCKLSKLCELVLRGSSIKQLWEGTMCLDNLKRMDLSDSQNLVKTPNLEELILGGCRKLKHIHPSTGNLTKLVLLDLSECTSLMSFPITILGITSLQYVKLRGCSRLFGGKDLENGRHGIIIESAIQCQLAVSSTFKRLKLRLPFHLFNSSKKSRYNDVFRMWRLSLARLSCLYYLDLSYCNLHSIPEAIASLHYLQILNLRGNNIVRVPGFINKLPRLSQLRLDHCKRLMYVDEFPLPLPYPMAERTAAVIWEPRSRMFNCPELVEKGRLSRMAISWMRKYLKVHKESTPKLEIVIPGSGIVIPRWFKHQSNSMRVESFPNAHDNNWIGIVLCAELVGQFVGLPAPHESIRLYFYDQTGKGGWMGDVGDIGERDGLMGELLLHLCLFYYPRQLFIWAKESYGMQHDLDGSRFEFKVLYPNYVDTGPCHVEVKNWGMRVLLNQDLE